MTTTCTQYEFHLPSRGDLLVEAAVDRGGDWDNRGAGDYWVDDTRIEISEALTESGEDVVGELNAAERASIAEQVLGQWQDGRD